MKKRCLSVPFVIRFHAPPLLHLVLFKKWHDRIRHILAIIRVIRALAMFTKRQHGMMADHNLNSGRGTAQQALNQRQLLVHDRFTAASVDATYESREAAR